MKFYRATRKLSVESLEDRVLLAVTAGGMEAASSLSAPTTWVVNTSDDPEGGWSTSDEILSLREALDRAEAGDTVTFDESLAGGTISLSGSQLEMTVGITVDASNIGGIRVDAGGKSRVFYLSGGTSENPVTLIGLTITGGGNVADGNVANGAGIYSSGVAILTDCTVTGNTASANTAAGGGIANIDGTMTITDCFITDNTANGSWMAYGGAIYNSGGVLTISGSLIADNEAAGSLYGYAGGIYNVSSGVLNVFSSTIAGNTASATWGSFGGGIWNDSEAAFHNGIVARNSAATSPDIYLSANGETIYARNTLSSFEGWTESSDCLVDDSSQALFADAESGDYALISGSQAIDVGDNAYVVSDTDLAGTPRIVNGTVDLGAYEYRSGEIERLEAPAITTGANGVYVSYGANRHRVVWTEVEGADSYELVYSDDGGSVWTAVETAENNVIVTGLTYGAEMLYRVRALSDGSYADSDWSETAAFNVCPMDVDNDGDISGVDRVLLASAWLAEEGDDAFFAAADIDGSGEVSGPDYVFMATNWLTEAGDEGLVYPGALADAALAEYLSADLGVDLDVF